MHLVIYTSHFSLDQAKNNKLFDRVDLGSVYKIFFILSAVCLPREDDQIKFDRSKPGFLMQNKFFILPLSFSMYL